MSHNSRAVNLAGLVALAAMLPACSGPVSHLIGRFGDCDKIPKFNVAMAASDAKEAVGVGNTELLAVYGYTVELPGTNMDATKLPKGDRYFIIPGTSDAITSSQCGKWNDTARSYAAIYNRQVLAKKK